MRRTGWVIRILCLLIVTGKVEATPIQNPGFERSLMDWTRTAESVQTVGTIYGIAPRQRSTSQAILATSAENTLPEPDQVNALLGTNFAVHSGSGSFVLASAMAQTVTVTAGVPLRLLFEWDFLTQDNPLSADSGRDGAFVTIDFRGDRSPDILVFLAEIQPGTAGGGLGLAAVPMLQDPPFLPPYTLHTGYHTYLSGMFTPETASITFGIGVADRLNDAGQSGRASGLLVDNFRLQGTAPTPVPEPGTLLLLGLGMLSVALWQRRGCK